MKDISLRLCIAVVLVALALTALPGCTNASLVRIHPWEHGTLADFIMRPDRDPLATAMADHVFVSRESAAGGRGVGGSGCGCN